MAQGTAALSRGDNIEKGHHVERCWGLLLATPLHHFQMEAVWKYSNSYYEMYTNQTEPGLLFRSTPCSPRDVNGLPYSFTGVHRCDDQDEWNPHIQDEWNREAQLRCTEAAREQYGSMAGITFQTGQSPDWSGSYTRWEDCNQEILGLCVDWAKKCRATFDSLDCPMQVCL